MRMNDTPKNRLVPGAMTVVIRDDSPMFHSNDSPSYRTVRIYLTTSQREDLAMREFEEISRAIIEPEPVTA